MYILRASRRSCSFAASFGPCMLPAHAGSSRPLSSGPNETALLKLARIGTATHGEGFCRLARDLTVRVEQGANRRVSAGESLKGSLARPAMNSAPKRDAWAPQIMDISSEVVESG